MFCLAISFLIFAASSFDLISNLIEAAVLSFIGADMQGLNFFNFMPEGPIAEFLDSQIENGLVIDYAFVTPPMD